MVLGVHAASPRQALHGVREFLQTTAAGPSRGAETRAEAPREQRCRVLTPGGRAAERELPMFNVMNGKVDRTISGKFR